MVHAARPVRKNVLFATLPSTATQIAKRRTGNPIKQRALAITITGYKNKNNNKMIKMNSGQSQGCGRGRV